MEPGTGGSWNGEAEFEITSGVTGEAALTAALPALTVRWRAHACTANCSVPP